MKEDDPRVQPCQGCGAPIVFLLTANNKAMPCEAEIKLFITEGEGKLSKGRVVHWGQCPETKQFRKPRNREKDVKVSKEKMGSREGGGIRYDTLLEDGRIYDAEVVEAESRYSKNDNEMIDLTLVVDGRLKTSFYAVEGTSWLDQLFESLDPDYVIPDEETEDQEDYDEQALVGRICRVKIKNEEWQGQTRSKPNVMMPHPDGPGEGNGGAFG